MKKGSLGYGSNAQLTYYESDILSTVPHQPLYRHSSFKKTSNSSKKWIL